jgi:hypothetical protein
MNIMSLVLQYFGPVILNKIAGSVGINSTLAQKAIAAAAPAILASILGKTNQSGGAKILADTIGKQDPGLLGRLGEIIGTGKQATVVEQGTSALSSILGNSALGSLAGALSKQAGLGIGASNTLLGLVTPAILGTLGREQKSAGLDAAGLATMLMGQKKNIADAIPADFAKLLSGTGLLDSVLGGNGAHVADKPAEHCWLLSRLTWPHRRWGWRQRWWTMRFRPACRRHERRCRPRRCRAARCPRAAWRSLPESRRRCSSSGPSA